jgi:hypothetical protein
VGRTMTAATLLDRLEGMRQTGSDRWLARCPAHDDRSPSLSVRELSDGTTLLRCHAGCSALAVVKAVGLELHNLFPPRPMEHHRGPVPRSQRPHLSMDEMLAVLGQHVTLTLLAAEDVAAGRTLTPADLEALRIAAARAHAVMEGAGRG